jgi:hypothetical protein
MMSRAQAAERFKSAAADNFKLSISEPDMFYGIEKGVELNQYLQQYKYPYF